MAPTERALIEQIKDEARKLRIENKFLKNGGELTDHHNRNRTLRPHCGGEGKLSDHVYLYVAKGIPIQLLHTARLIELT